MLQAPFCWPRRLGAAAVEQPSPLPRPPELESCEPLRDERGVKYAILTPSAFGYHPVTIFNLAGINVVDRFAAVLLADPFRRAVELHGPLLGRILVTNGQRRFILT